jgi:hypothetical protein
MKDFLYAGFPPRFHYIMPKTKNRKGCRIVTFAAGENLFLFIFGRLFEPITLPSGRRNTKTFGFQFPAQA